MAQDSDSEQDSDEEQYKEVDAETFYRERILESETAQKTIKLPHKTGAVLSNVILRAVSKKEIADAIGDMPDELFQAAEEGNVDPEEAEEIARQHGASAAIDATVVEGFEDLIVASLHHDGLSETQIRRIVEELSFQGLFELGSEVLNYSIQNSGDVEGFLEQS